MADPEVIQSPIGTLTLQPDGNYKTASGGTVARSVALSYANSQTTKAVPDPNANNPYDPQSYTPDQRVNILSRAGFKYLPGSGTGPGALWVDGMGNTAVEGNILKGLLSPNAAGAGDTSAQVDSTGTYFVIKNGKGFLLDGVTPYTPVGRNVNTMTAGESAQVGLGYARLGQDQQQFNQNFEEGKRQFDQKFTRGNFESDRAFTEARDQFAKKVAEDARQFDLGQQGQNDRLATQEAGAFQRAVLNEQGANSRAALNAQTQGFNTMAQLTPQLGRLAIDNANTVADFTRKPADFLARAHFTRGGTSPLPQVTQADLINNLSGQISGFNDVLSKYNTNPFQGFSVPSAPAAVTRTAPVRTIPESTYVVSGPNAGSIAATDTGRAVANDNLRKAGAPSWLPGFATGGVTHEPMFKVGENPDGSMNETTEVVANPTNAPIGVISNPELTGKADVQEDSSGGETADDMDAAQEQKKAAAIGKVLQHIDTPEVIHALVDEMFDHKGKAKKKMPGFASGTGYGFDAGAIGTAGGFSGPTSDMTYQGKALDRGFQGVNGKGTYYSQGGNAVYADQLDSPSNGFRLPGVQTTTQAELQALEAKNRPPAITSILNGQAPKPLNLGFSLPTPGLLNTLTPDEYQAFGTTLATQYNLSPSDVEAAIRQRFAGSGARSARF